MNLSPANIPEAYVAQYGRGGGLGCFATSQAIHFRRGDKVVLATFRGLELGTVLSSQIIARGFLRSAIFFPVLLSTIGIGITWKALMDPFDGLINQALAVIGVQ